MLTSKYFKILTVFATGSVLIACGERTPKQAIETPPALMAAQVQEAKLDFTNVSIKDSYAIGQDMGSLMKSNLDSIKETKVQLDTDIIIEGFIEGISGKNQLTEQEFNQTLVAFKAKVLDEMERVKKEKQDKATAERLAKQAQAEKDAEALKRGEPAPIVPAKEATSGVTNQ
jgi:hypothetical protein